VALTGDSIPKLRLRSCIIDGEAVACGEDGLSSFDRIRHRRYDESVFMWAFDLIELDADDLRLEPLGARKATLARISRQSSAGFAVERAHRGGRRAAGGKNQLCANRP
jgi:ATP-dependent DNA ligase